MILRRFLLIACLVSSPLLSACLGDPDAPSCEKVAGDHNADLVEFMEEGDYAIFEGIYSQGVCRRGPHLNHGGHGAVAGQITCVGP